MTDTTGVLERMAKAFAERDGFIWTNERVLMTGRGGSRTRLTFVRQAEEHLAIVQKAGLILAAHPSAGAQGVAVAWQIQGDDGRWHNYEPQNEAQKNAALSPENPWRMRALGVIATPAQPDTGDVAALLEALGQIKDEIRFADDPDSVALNVIEGIVDAALSKPNAPGASDLRAQIDAADDNAAYCSELLATSPRAR